VLTLKVDVGGEKKGCGGAQAHIFIFAVGLIV